MLSAPRTPSKAFTVDMSQLSNSSFRYDIPTYEKVPAEGSFYKVSWSGCRTTALFYYSNSKKIISGDQLKQKVLAAKSQRHLTTLDEDKQ